MPGRRPRKVDCTGDSLASDVAVVMVSFLWSCGWQRGNNEGSWCWRRFGIGDSQIVLWRLGLVAAANQRNWVVLRRFFRAKALRFCASGGDACGCRYPHEGDVQASGWKPLTFGLDDGGVVRRHPLGGVVMELRFLSVSVRCHRWATDPNSRHLALARGVCSGLLSYIRDFVFTTLCPRCPLAGSVLHIPEREGRQPFLVTTWGVWCDYIWWFHKEVWWHL
jgi:hypothetical protein